MTDLPQWQDISAAMYAGQSLAEAARTQHLISLPVWEARCTCWRDVDHYTSPGPVLANEHVACHQKDCDIHSGAVERWKERAAQR